jgi:sugar phosphate isomerase/epimerase
MNRRDCLLSLAGGTAALLLHGPTAALGAEGVRRTRLGVADFSYNVRLKAEQAGLVEMRLSDPLNFLDHCDTVGAGGIQIDMGVRDQAYLQKLRSRAESRGMFIEGSAGLPQAQKDVEKFDAAVRTAQQAGATVIRTAIGGRRYEQFEKAEQFKAFAQRSLSCLQLAEPVVARYGMRLAIENHKDWRVPELLRMLERIGSEHVGVCVDTGNSVALLEDPMEVVRAFAPWGFSVHLKDMAVAEYGDGFLLADVALGRGLLDLPEMVRILRKARPEIRFCLEGATRDALKVPCLTDRYWATFEDVPGSDLARTLRYIRAHASDESSLPHVEHLSLEERLRCEQNDVRESLTYAAEHLDC